MEWFIWEEKLQVDIYDMYVYILHGFFLIRMEKKSFLYSRLFLFY